MRNKILTLVCSLSLFLAFNNQVNAFHLYGGDLSYAYVRSTMGGTMHEYEVTLTLYQDCAASNWLSAHPQSSVQISVHEGALNATALPLSTQRATSTLLLTDSFKLESNLPNGCVIGGPCIYKTTYFGTVTVPTTFVGYHFIYDRCCRTSAAANLNIPGGSTVDGTIITSWTASTSIKNTSPKFRDFDFPFICINKTNSVLNIAQDPDGDLLNYSFYSPFDGLASPGDYTGGYATAFPSSLAPYRTGFSAQQPLGGGTISINGLTGFTTMNTTVAGDYVVGIKVIEIDKNGQTVGVVHREYQFPFVNCNDTNNTQPQLAGSGKSDYEIDAGDTLCFDIEFEDKGGSPLDYLYRVEGLIFDTNFTKPAANLSTPIFTPGKSKQEFCWTTTCEQGRPTKYYFSATVADSACVPNQNSVVFSVLVNPAKTPKVINGPSSLCAGASNVVYTTDTIPGLIYNWTVAGGSIVSGGTGPSITVNWGNGPGGNIQVSGVNSNGCQGDTIDKAVFVATFPVNAGRDTLLCSGDTVILGGTASNPTAPNGYTIRWSSGSFLNIDTIANPRAFPNITTDFILSVTDTTGNCTVVDTITVRVGVNPSASISNDTTLCEGNQTSLLASGGTKYTWSPGILLNDSTIANPITNITSDQLFIVKIEDPGNACLTLDSVLVTLDEQRDLDPGTDSSICFGLTHILGGRPTGVPNATFNWTPSANLSSATDTNPIYTLLGIDTTTFFVTMTTPAGCVFNDSIEVRVDSIPIVDLLFGRDTICQQDTTFIEATGGVSYTWNVTGITGAGPHIITPNAGFMYKVIGTDSNFCSAQDSQFIQVKTIPQISISQDTIFLCNLDTIKLSTPLGATSYAWSPNYNILPDTTVAEPSVFPRVDTTYVVRVSNFDGCDGVDSIRIEVDSIVPTEAGPAITFCAPDTIQIGGNPTSPTFNTTYSWSPSIGLSNSTIANPNTFSDTTTMYTVNTSNGRCIGADSVLVTVKNRPTVTFARNPYEVCIGDTIEIDTLSSTGTLASVLINPIPTVLIGGSGFKLNIAPLTSNSYDVILTDTNGCIDTSKLTINVVAPPNVNAGKDTFECAGTPIQLVATGASTYSWSPSNVLDKPNSPTPVANADTLTQFIVVGTTQNGCKATDTVIIDVRALPIVDAGNPLIVCSDTVTTIRLGGNPTGDPTTRFVWSPNIDLDNPSSPNPICTFTLPRTYLLLGIDTSGCVNSDTADIRLYSFKVNNVAIDCSNDTIQLNLYDTFGTPPFIYEWSPSIGLSDPSIPNPKVTTDTSITYQVKVTDTIGCTDSALVEVFVKGLVKSAFELQIQADCDNTTVTALNRSENASEFNWTLNGESISTEESPVFTFPYESSFSIALTAKSDEGCVAVNSSDTATVKFDDYFTGKIPNIFTPNDDGINDLFDFRLGNRLEQCSEIKIYNRWGALVFESRENSHIWDGRTFTGDLCSEGVYFFTLSVNGTSYKGNVTLIRN